MAAILAVSLAFTLPTHAAFVDLTFAGASSRDGWVSITASSFFRGTYPGNANWSSPIGSNESGSGDAELARLAGETEDGDPNTTSGGPYPAFESLYFGSVRQIPNWLGGTLRISDPTPLAGAKTIAFQIQIGEADGYDFHEPTGLPVLRVNGTTVLAPFATQLLNRYQSGTFFSPETEQDEPVYVNSWGFQWNINGLGPITSLEIDFSGVTHAQIYRMRLQQAEDLVTRNIFLPDLRLTQRGQPAFDGSSTSVTHRFVGPPDAELDIEFSESLAAGGWSSAGTHTTGPDGTVDVVFTKPGNHVLTWSRGLFFRSSYHAIE